MSNALFLKRARFDDQVQLNTLAGQLTTIVGGVWVSARDRNPWFQAEFAAWLTDPRYARIPIDSVAVDTGVELNRFDFPNTVRIVGRPLQPEYGRIANARSKPDVIGVTFGDKAPGFITIQQAGYHSREHFADTLAYAVTAMFRGYYGSVSLYSDNRYGHGRPPHSECVHVALGEGELVLKVRWVESDQYVSALLNACRVERFVETTDLHQPVPAA
ncbi:MAG: hypothetical protein AAB442_03455 [Patescibacteria group bacterium]